jgi:hypothetical protein
MKPGNLSIAPHIRPTTLSRTVRLLEDHGQRVMYKVSPLSLVLGAKLSLEGNGSGPDSVSSMAYRNRAKSRRNSDGLGIARLQFKFVVDCGVLFCYSNATITPKGAKRGSLGGVDKEPILLDTFPLSVCHVTVDPAPASTQTGPHSIPSLSIFTSNTNEWLLTLYFDDIKAFNLWEITLVAASSSSSPPFPASSSASFTAFSTATTSPHAAGTPATATATAAGGSLKTLQRQGSHYDTWVASSPHALNDASICHPDAVRQSMRQMETKSKQLRNKSLNKKSSFMAQLEAQTHLFGCEVGWRTLKLIDRDDGKHGHHHHHTRADTNERKDVTNDSDFLQQLSHHQRLRHVALNEDSPQFQKHLAALQEQVRGVKHNSQKLLQSSINYFQTGSSFVMAGHQFAQDMLRFAPYQREEWELSKGLVAKKNNIGKNAKKNIETTMKDLEEDTTKTRKLQIIAEELTLLIREGMVHLEVLLSQQEEILIKPLEHLVSVQSKVCKQTKERYDREKKLYLTALSKYQSMKKGDSKTLQMKKEVDLHAKIFQDARFECALKLGSFDATRDTRYLEQLAQWLHVQTSYFSHGISHFGGDKSAWMIDTYRSVAKSNETCEHEGDLLKREFEKWKLTNGSDKKTSIMKIDIGSDSGGSGMGGRSLNASPVSKNSSLRSSPSFYEGFLMIRSKRWKNKWKRRWFTCDGRQFFYCKTAAQDAVRAAEIDLTMASVRLARNVPRDFCFEVVSSSPGGGLRIMVLQAESKEEMTTWIKAVTAGISAQLDALAPSNVSGTGGGSGSSNTGGGNAEGQAQRERQLTMITETKGNDKCADCSNTEGVEWCSLNLGVVLCLECAGVHRGLGVHISQCRSFKLDVMDESILSMFASLGNEVANQVWGNEVVANRPTPTSSREDKEIHVKNKYVKRKYIQKNVNEKDEIGASLIDAAAKGNMELLLNHVAWETDLDYVSVHGATALSAAAHRGHPAPITLLLLNHADVNKCGTAGWSPLHAAAYGGKDEAVRLLMAKGGDEYAKEKHGATPIDIALRCENWQSVILMGGSVPDGVSLGGSDIMSMNGTDNEVDAGFSSSASTGSGNNSPNAAVSKARRVSDGNSEVKNPMMQRTNSIRNAARRSSMRRREDGGMNGPAATSLAGERLTGDVVTALFAFKAEAASELSLDVGQIYIVLKPESSSGWTYGENDKGEKGLFPSQYVETK